MNRDELKEILNDSTLLEVEVEYLADQILSLINAERCVWTYDDWQIHGQDVYKTSCDMFEFYEGYTYCPKCGKRIEVKE